jgi:hypothetical protein
MQSDHVGNVEYRVMPSASNFDSLRRFAQLGVAKPDVAANRRFS